MTTQNNTENVKKLKFYSITYYPEQSIFLEVLSIIYNDETKPSLTIVGYGKKNKQKIRYYRKKYADIIKISHY